MPQGLEPLCSGARLGELGVLTWRGEGSRESSEPLAGPKGAPGELQRDFGVTEQGGMASQCQRAGLDGILGRNCSL